MILKNMMHCIVAQMAVEDVNINSEILSNHKLVLSINDGKCEADVVMKRFIDIIKNKDKSRFRSTVGILGNEIPNLITQLTYCVWVLHVLTLLSPLSGSPSTSVQLLLAMGQRDP